MFKRANKITALLVAAASVMSVVPAMASDVKKVESQDGTVYNAVAYKDGKALIDGEVNDNDAAYYYADGKYTELEDVDSDSTYTNFDSKYVEVDGGDYYVDLTSGKVTDDSLAEDAADDAASAMRKKIKGDADDRYSDDAALKTATVLPGGLKFGETWYETTYTANSATTNNAAGSLAVYTDVDGNYIDADYNLGKIKVKTTESAVVNGVTKEFTDTVNVTNTDDTFDSAYTEDAVTAGVVVNAVIGQDADYIYRTATITVLNTKGAITEINGMATTKLVFTPVANGFKFDVIQKISKAQASDDVDGAFYAKSVQNYAISDEDGVADALLAGAKFTVADGKVIAYTFAANSVDVQTIALASTQGFYYTDITDVDSEDADAIDTDVDGNIYRLDGGAIYKFDNDEDWNKVYKVDGSFEEFSVYDEDNMVAWNEDDEVYSIIGATTTDEDTTVETPVVTAGWAQAANGTWTYNKADGTKATGWLLDGATWYYLKADGVMATGWVNDGGTWYYLAGSGAMKTGWVNDNGTWYYLAGSGAMLANTTVDGYVLGANGAWVK